ncbi:Transmembrane BAX inhibitor motif-containing protein 4 [Aphelenchoides bicaudatus]|nr:Transmembrane BAX inhibitor motif-containing protein 4 [Aphelenchoides bicaudatus]
MSSTRTSEAQVPLLEAEEVDDDVERGALPNYAEAAQSGQRVGFVAGAKPNLRPGKDPVALADTRLRMGFLRKVLGILLFQFGVTVILSTALYLTPVVRGFIHQQPWIMFTCIFGSIGVLLALFVHAHNVPMNYFLLGIWTIMQALTVASIVTFYDLEVVVQALLITVAVVGSLFAYTLQTKRDWSKGYAILGTLSMAFIFATLLQIILMSSVFNFAMSLFGAALFSAYLVFDLDMVLHVHSEEDYVIACVMIYMDVVNLFLNILRIVAEANRN